MELSYWESRWRKNNIGFHMEEAYPGLRHHWDSLPVGKSPSVLVPLCGKSPDLLFLEQKGARVTGVEYAEKAVLSFFEEHNRPFEVVTRAGFRVYQSGNIELWQGDFMKFPGGSSSGFSLIYDKAALVALPPGKRAEYMQKLMALSGTTADILLHHFIYPQQQMPGPPFSVPGEEIRERFERDFTITMLEENHLPAKRFPPFQRRGLKSPILERFLYLSKNR